MNLYANLDQANLNFVDYLTSNLRSKKTSSSIAIAKALADSLSLPPSSLSNGVNRGPLDTSVSTSILNDYRARHKINVMNSIYGLNEYVPLNVSEIEDLVFKFYKGRYFVLYPQTMILAVNDRPVYDFFNISMALDPEIIKTIEADYGDITIIYKSAKRYFQLCDKVTSGN